MKKLYLLRHAKSDYPANVRDDKNRPLNERGKNACKIMGAFLKENNIAPDMIISSDALRTKQTIKNIIDESCLRNKVDFTKNLYLASAGEILKEVAKINNNLNNVMVVAHNPGIQELAAILFKDGDEEKLRKIKTKYPTASLSSFILHTNSWSEIYPASCTLEFFVSPKDLVAEK